VPDDAVGVHDAGPVVCDDAAAQPDRTPTHTENLNVVQLAASYPHGADTTTHLPLANSQADFGLVGETNPAVTDSGRLVIPLARPKWTPQQAMDPATHPGLLARIAFEAPHLRPQVARNPSASGELLNWLAGLNDPDVNLALASLRAAGA